MDGQTYYLATTCHVGGTEADLIKAANELRGFMTPAPQGAIEGWLAELSVITARKQGDEFEEGLRLRAYATRLAAYPADVARHVCLVHSWRFWPSWAEMEEVCRAKVSSRAAIIRALDAEPNRRAAEAAERARYDQIQAERQARWDAKKAEADQAAAARAKCAAYIAAEFPDLAARFPRLAEDNYQLECAQHELWADADLRTLHPEAFS